MQCDQTQAIARRLGLEEAQHKLLKAADVQPSN
jgi:hypothetical protein